ncbi:hypothetical protein [Niabella aquatica]
MRNYILTLLTAINFITVYSQNTEALKNEGIIKMYKSGLSKEVILKKIQTAPVKSFDLNTDALIQLKKENIPDTIVLLMMNQVSIITEPVLEKEPIKQNKPNTALDIDQDAPRDISQLSAEGVYYKNPETGVFDLLPLKNIMPFDIVWGRTSSKAKLIGKKASFTINDKRPSFYIKIKRGDAPSTMSLQPSNLVLYKGESTSKGRIVTFGTKVSALRKPEVEQISNSVYKITFVNEIGLGTFLIAPQETLQFNCYEFNIEQKAKRSSQKEVEFSTDREKADNNKTHTPSSPFLFKKKK